MQEPTKRQIQAMNTKKKLYDISTELMKTKGYDNVTIQEICKKAGVSVGSFYHYFESKNDIFIELYKIADDFFYDTIKGKLSSENTINKIIEYFNYYAEYNEKMGIDMMKQLYNSNNKMFITKGRHMQTVLDIIIEQGQKNNEVTTEMTPKQITKFLFVLMRGIVYDWCLHDGEYDLKEKMKSMLMQILKTIKP
ncbi:TetR family transcriptional regulator [Clostridium botulinum]|uniref:TetR family transcriptional regulator n=1 Tax=Clostridium botulinum C/D str. DC5 TaxID=1443128 RepID=A0A0A0IMM2_CLOBO|nr:TetR/AcrR family transcriptional regulator [Clostridium botulinum]KEI00851.1 TetR family transcriptional regulator [Clostridium botulinum C/D str. BKT75002]KEI09165.1 TetR family transcriptional regulator [Clostridium botulinum C/D str. BKT2873]KGM96206.1 TetR family transcriptional regulator [Clostridium botulinum D str. CCUG 7971]KGN00781.1 TetR family transcriptional regulator [Clostridium botulinum C/D str. DC5]KOC46237.1 TetR family transcriptional regulator [Clostridium botulinum]